MSDLALLRAAVEQRLSPYRLAHTLGVVDAVSLLADLYLPEKKELAIAAALLHDIAKEMPESEQRSMMAECGVSLRPDEEASPAIFHGITASLLIPAEYPAWDDPDLCSAVRWHTTGHVGMTLFEALLYLADYIEQGRPFADCVAARALFFDAAPERMERGARLAHLRKVLLFVLERTLLSLEKRGAVISVDTAETHAWLKNEKNPFV